MKCFDEAIYADYAKTREASGFQVAPVRFFVLWIGAGGA
jgi:hypothetical protein